MSDLNSIKKDILNLVKEYVREKNGVEWDKDKDWVEYSGPTFDEDEYVAAIDTLLAGWFIMGKDSREFELEFPAESVAVQTTAVVPIANIEPE